MSRKVRFWGLGSLAYRHTHTYMLHIHNNVKCQLISPTAVAAIAETEMYFSHIANEPKSIDIIM